MSSSETTIDHETIKNWTEARGGRPSLVPTAGGKGKKKTGGVLRLDFGPKEDNLKEVTWEEFFEVFEQSQLAFLFQDKTADGSESRFSRFVHRSGEEEAPKKAEKGAKNASSKEASSKGDAAEKAAAKKAPAKKADAREGDGSGATTKAELMEKAREKNIPGRSKMSKEELEKALA